MLRLALLATAIAYANAATSGEAFTLFQVADDDSSGVNTPADSHAACIESALYEPTGVSTTTGPMFKTATIALKGVSQSKVFIAGECYNMPSTGDVPMGIMGVAADADAELGPDDAASLSFKFKKGDGVDAAGGAILNAPYIESYDLVDCAQPSANTPMEPTVGTNAGNVGWQCGGTLGSLSSGFKDGTDSGGDKTVHGWRTITYVGISNFDDAAATAPAGETCATGETDNDGTETFYMHIAADDDEAHGTVVSGDDTDGAWKKRQDAACYVDLLDEFGTASSYQAVCDAETGDVVWTDYGTDDCTAAADSAIRFNKNDYGTATMSCSKVGATNNWGALSADIATVCAGPAGTATAKWFTGYLADDATNCAALDNSAALTASHVDGTKAIIIGVCYVNQAADGRMTGFAGPFSAGTAATEPIARSARSTVPAGGSYMFTEESSGHIGLHSWISPDCSKTAADTATQVTDDPNNAATTDWACDVGTSTFVTHGGQGTSGNATAQLQTASYYLTVRAHGDKTGGNPNMGGTCQGQTNPASGQRVDHFILDQCMQSATATSYKFKCESAGATYTNGTTEYYAISYDTYSDAACATATGTAFKYFTQTSFSACAISATGLTCTAALSDTAAEWALNELHCGACSGTAAREDTCLALTSAGTWTAGDGVTTTTTGRTTGSTDTTCTSTHGSATEWGGRCLQNGAGAVAGATWNSWEIMTDNATWAAMCGPATPAPASSTTTTTSGAGKIAATAAAAAAAAALLL